ncbi:MAG: hypothetical protein AAB393_19025, partial [Bacteroidota bacterium]
TDAYFGKIQRAIDQAASSQTLDVVAGTYSETISLTKNLTITSGGVLSIVGDLTVNSSVSVTLNANVSVGGNVVVQSSGATLTVSATKALTTTANVQVQTGGTLSGAGTLSFEGDGYTFTNNGVVGASTIFENIEGGLYYIAGNGTWGSVLIEPSVDVRMSGDVEMLNCNITVNGDLDTQSNTFLLNGTSAASLVVGASGSISGSGETVQTQGSVSIIQNGDFDESLEVLSGTTSLSGVFNNVQINSPGNIVLSGATTVNGTLNVSGGSLTTGSNVLTLGGSATITETPPYSVVGNLVTARPCTTGTNQTFGGMGVEINLSGGPSVNTTTVTRVTGTASTLPTGASI